MLRLTVKKASGKKCNQILVHPSLAEKFPYLCLANPPSESRPLGKSFSYATLGDSSVGEDEVRLNLIQRQDLSVSLDSFLEAHNPGILDPSPPHLHTLLYARSLRNGASFKLELTEDELTTMVIGAMTNLVIQDSKHFFILFKGEAIQFSFGFVGFGRGSGSFDHDSSHDDETKTFIWNPESTMVIEDILVEPPFQKSLVLRKPLLRSRIDFREMGIGGLRTETEEICRRVFYPYALDKDLLKDLGHVRVRGVLLYGPPGCGKTLIAKQLASFLHCPEPKKVNGPELLSKYVGESERLLRELFAEADADPDQVHVIIMDELDSMFKVRGSTSDGTGVGDSMVNQFLTMMDGLQERNSAIVFGLTNRRELIDPALLRPGRFEVQLRIGLPDEEARLEILEIHTQALKA